MKEIRLYGFPVEKTALALATLVQYAKDHPGVPPGIGGAQTFDLRSTEGIAFYCYRAKSGALVATCTMLAKESK